MRGECGREGGGQDGVEWGGKWDNCNSIINKYIKKKKKNLVLSEESLGDEPSQSLPQIDKNLDGAIPAQ